VRSVPLLLCAEKEPTVPNLPRQGKCLATAMFLSLPLRGKVRTIRLRFTCRLIAAPDADHSVDADVIAGDPPPYHQDA